MKKVIVGVGLGLATASQAQAWTGGIEDMRTMEANQHGQVVRVKSSKVECCRLRPVRSQARQTKRIYHGKTYYCTDATATHAKTRHVAPQRNHQQVLQAQRAKRQAMYAAQAKRKAMLLAQQRKRAALIAQQKRRAVQLAQQQRRAAHQAQILAQKKRHAALLIQKKRRAMQLAQQKRQAMQLAQKQQQLAKRRALLAQQKQRVINQQRPVQRHVAQEVVIERYTYPTYVSRSAQPAPAPMTRSAPRISVSQSVVGQSVDYHDQQHSRSAWQAGGTVHQAQPQYHQRKVAHQHSVRGGSVQKSAAYHHKAKLRQQRLAQIRARQIAAQKHRQYQTQKQIRMAPIAPYVAPDHVASQSVTRSHSGGWQRGSAVQSHGMGNMYGRYAG